MSESYYVIILSGFFVYLERYIPYTVSVRAQTSAGFSEPTEAITFTEEGGKLDCYSLHAVKYISQ